MNLAMVTDVDESQNNDNFDAQTHFGRLLRVNICSSMFASLNKRKQNAYYLQLSKLFYLSRSKRQRENQTMRFGN